MVRSELGSHSSNCMRTGANWDTPVRWDRPRQATHLGPAQANRRLGRQAGPKDPQGRPAAVVFPGEGLPPSEDNAPVRRPGAFECWAWARTGQCSGLASTTNAAQGWQGLVPSTAPCRVESTLQMKPVLTGALRVRQGLKSLHHVLGSAQRCFSHQNPKSNGNCRG